MAIRTMIQCSFLVIGAFAAAATAAPAQAGNLNRALDNRAPTTATTIEQASATCVPGAAASTTSAYPVDYAAVAAPENATGSYDIDESFRAAHHVGSVTRISLGPGSDASDFMEEYGPFKCQYTCNGTPGCVSFFGRLVNVNSTREQSDFECMSFDALLDQSAFTSISQNVAVGGFNKFCKQTNFVF